MHRYLFSLVPESRNDVLGSPRKGRVSVFMSRICLKDSDEFNGMDGKSPRAKFPITSI